MTHVYMLLLNGCMVQAAIEEQEREAAALLAAGALDAIDKIAAAGTWPTVSANGDLVIPSGDASVVQGAGQQPAAGASSGSQEVQGQTDDAVITISAAAGDGAKQGGAATVSQDGQGEAGACQECRGG